MNKTVLITGGAINLGAAIATKFASKGYNIIINYLTHEQEANELKEDLEQKYSIRVITIKADVSYEEEVIKMLKEVLNHFETIDVLVNNAAISIDKNFEEKTKEDFEKIMNVNLFGTFLTCKCTGSIMKKQGYGSIINIASTNGIDTYKIYSLDYDASKAGVISLTHNLASEFAPYIRVNAIAPGWINTKPVLEMNPTIIKEEQEKILLNRFGKTEEIANVVYFVASDEASYINGSVIRVDGGLK